jgi:hypothetical protein
MVVETDYIDSCKSNYNTRSTTTAPLSYNDPNKPQVMYMAHRLRWNLLWWKIGYTEKAILLHQTLWVYIESDYIEVPLQWI